MSTTRAPIELAGLGQVAPGYDHRDKRYEARDALALPRAVLKWYDLASPATPVSPEIHAAARDFLRGEAASGTLALEGDLGFVILHRCGAQFHFLLVSTWRNENELWESVYARHDDARPQFVPFEFGGSHRGTFCVWELGAVWHETQAWKRYLRTARDDAARAAWLCDTGGGEV